MARPKKQLKKRRVQLRIKTELLSLFDSYSPDELSELMNMALGSLSPGVGLGGRVVSVVRPPVPISDTICRLMINGESIRLLFPEMHDEFRRVVKDLGYSWQNPYWAKTAKKESISDRAAEVAHRLLLKGFCVQVESEIVKQKAISAKYEPEHYRKISACKTAPWDGWFVLSWPRSEDLYDEVKKITASKWTDKGMVVPSEHYREIEDFAEANSFWISPDADQVILSANQHWENALIVSPQEHHKREVREYTPPLDTSLATIPSELMDNEP